MYNGADKLIKHCSDLEILNADCLNSHDCRAAFYPRAKILQESSESAGGEV